MEQPKLKGWGPGRLKGLLITFAVMAFVSAGIFWMSTMATGPSNANADKSTTAEVTSTTSANPDDAGAPAEGPLTTSQAPVPPPSLPPVTTLPPAEATAKAEEDAASALVPQPTAPPQEFTAEATPEEGITVSVASIEAVKGEGQMPGQISGPSIRFTITLVNDGPAEILTDKVVVNVEGGADSAPAIQLSGPGASLFPESTKPGETSTGTFVFLIPNDQRDQVRIFFNYQVSSPIVAFEGAVPKAQ